MLTIGCNNTDTVIVVDEAGFSIEGGFWGVIDTLDAIAKVELDSGRIVKVNPSILENVDPNHERAVEIAAVVQALADRKARREAAAELEKDELLEQVDDPERLEAGGDGVPHKDDLVDAVVAEATAEGSDVVDETPDPEPASAKTPAKKSTRRSAAN